LQGNRAVRAKWGAKKPFVFNEPSARPANFSKFFLGRIEGNQRLAGEKIWKSNFSRFRARPPRLSDPPIPLRSARLMKAGHPSYHES
jgi:hypothetical protein